MGVGWWFVAEPDGAQQAPVKDAAAASVETAPNADSALAQPETGGSGSKVELDLDDAPFLKVEEEKPQEKAPPPATVEASPPEPAPKKSKKKLIVVIAAVAVLIIGAAVWWFVLRTPPPPPPEPPKPEVIVVPSKPAVAEQKDYIKDLKPFTVPYIDPLGKSLFLVCKFSVMSKVPDLDRQIDPKIIAVRDAIYFYLRGKTGEFILNPVNAQTVKEDLTAVLNDYMTQGKIDDVLFESYLKE